MFKELDLDLYFLTDAVKKNEVFFLVRSKSSLKYYI